MRAYYNSVYKTEAVQKTIKSNRNIIAAKDQMI